jgi:transposase
MHKLSPKKRLAIAQYYLSGMSYDEIAAECDVSKGSVANVVADLKAGRFPEAADFTEHIELLRELSLDLKRSALSPGQCALGLAVLTQIRECGLDPADISHWPMILKQVQNESEAHEFVRLVYSIQEVQERTGLGLEALDSKVHELEKKAADLEPVSRQHDDCQKQLTKLTEQRDNLSNATTGLEEKFQFLDPRVKEMEGRERDLSRQLKGMEPRARKAESTLDTLDRELQRLEGTGLSLEDLIELNQRLVPIAQRHGIAPAEFRDKLLRELESLGRGLELEALVKKHKQELKQQEQAVARAKQDTQTTKVVITNLNQEKADLKASINNTREKVSKEIAKIPPIANDMISRLVGELRRGHGEVLAEVRQLKDEVWETGREVGHHQELLQANQWLTELMDLVRGEEHLDSSRVRVIALQVLRGLVLLLKHEKQNNLAFSPLLSTAENLIRELEQWKI